MSAPVQSRLLALVAAVVVLVGSAGAAGAGWVTVRNDSNRVLIVQETTCTGNGPATRCKPVRLLPGESVKGFQPTGASIKIEVFDGQNPAKSLYAGSQTSREKDQTFSITADGKTVSVTAVGAKEPGK